MTNLNNYVAVLDCETNKNDLVYDIGLVIGKLNKATQQYEIVETHSYLIKEIFDIKEIFMNAYYSNKRGLYHKKVNSGEILKVSRKTCFNRLEKALTRYGIETILAYNVDFDSRVISHNARVYNLVDIFKNRNTQCIYKMTTSSLPTDNNVLDFWYSNNLITSSGKCLSFNAENVYKYISNNVHFVEEHTGLADCFIELEILNHLIIGGYELDFNANYETQFIKNKNYSTVEVVELVDVDTKEFIKSVVVYKKSSYNGMTKLHILED